MTDKEKILEAIEQKRQAIWPTDTGEMKPATVPNHLEQGWLNALAWMRYFINSIPSEQPSEDLEKFIQDLIDKYPVNKESVPNGSLNDYYQGLRFGVLQGAKCQKEQMMKSAIDAVIVNDETSGCVVDCEQGCLVLEPHTYPIGQKLKILIIKEDGK